MTFVDLEYRDISKAMQQLRSDLFDTKWSDLVPAPPWMSPLNAMRSNAGRATPNARRMLSKQLYHPIINRNKYAPKSVKKSEHVVDKS